MGIWWQRSPVAWNTTPVACLCGWLMVQWEISRVLRRNHEYPAMPLHDTTHGLHSLWALLQPDKFSTILSCFSLWMGLDLSIKFLFLALLPFWLTCRRIIYCFSGGLNIPITSTMRRAAFQNCRLCCMLLHSYLFPNSCKWMEKRK